MQGDCGFWGISKEQCLGRGCCFGPANASGPQCFFTRRNFTRAVSLDVRGVGGGRQCWSVLPLRGGAASTACAAGGRLNLTVDDSVRLLLPEAR